MKNRLSINMYPQKNGLQMLVLKTDIKTMRIRNLKDGMAVKADLVKLGKSLVNGREPVGILNIEVKEGRPLQLGIDAQIVPARLLVKDAGFLWRGTITALKRALRPLL